MQPTKFAKLLKVVMPLVQGGLAGAASDPHQQKGGEEAQQFFQQQTANQIRKNQLQMQTKNMQSEQRWRDSEGRRADAQAQGAGKMYVGQDATGESYNYRIGENGTSEQLQKARPNDRYKTFVSGNKIEKLDSSTGVISPATSEEPGEPTQTEDQLDTMEGTPGPNRELPLEAPTKQPAASSQTHVLGEDQELIDTDKTSPTYGKPIATGKPKTFAPKNQRTATAPKPDVTRMESAAGALLSKYGGDPQKAMDAVDGLKNATGEEKVALRARIREMKKPAPGAGKSNYFEKYKNNPASKQALSTAPPE
jgi:hypothetical protein